MCTIFRTDLPERGAPLKNPPALDAARDPLRGPRPLRPRQQRRLPGVFREDPHRLLARPRRPCRHRRARSRRRTRRPLRDRRDHRPVQSADLLRRHPPRRGPHAHRRQPLLHHGLRAAYRRDLRETARSSRKAPPPTSSSTPYRTRSNRAPTGFSPPSRSSKAAPRNRSPRKTTRTC